MRRSAKKWRVSSARLDLGRVKIRDEKTRTFLTERAWLPTREDRREGGESPEAQRMLSQVEMHLSWTADSVRTVKDAPTRAHKLENLDALIRAQRALVAAIENLDTNTWSELVLTEATMDLKKCELPAGHSK